VRRTALSLIAFALAATPAQAQAHGSVSLAGTAWRAIGFQARDDRAPPGADSSSRRTPPMHPFSSGTYTISFGQDGRVAVVADCNRGSGSWTSPGQGQLRFGMLTMTLARCAGQSMSARFVNDFQYMTSYSMKDGRLYIGLMADGGTYELEPLK
jgi:para-nitrobenzyl esterase